MAEDVDLGDLPEVDDIGEGPWGTDETAPGPPDSDETAQGSGAFGGVKAGGDGMANLPGADQSDSLNWKNLASGLGDVLKPIAAGLGGAGGAGPAAGAGPGAGAAGPGAGAGVGPGAGAPRQTTSPLIMAGVALGTLGLVALLVVLLRQRANQDKVG